MFGVAGASYSMLLIRSISRLGVPWCFQHKGGDGFVVRVSSSMVEGMFVGLLGCLREYLFTIGRVMPAYWSCEIGFGPYDCLGLFHWLIHGRLMIVLLRSVGLDPYECRE